ncbi:MAG TPA: hypothetical protein VF476_11045 [Chitinophagaceae bacterium]
MKALYFLKAPIVVFLIGYLCLQAGALLKIRHWPGADETITLSYFVIGIAVLLALFKIISLKKPE